MSTEAERTDPRPWVLVTAPPPLESSFAILDKSFNIVMWEDFFENRSAYLEKIEGFLDIATIPRDLQVLRLMPNLKVVANHGIGINHLNLPLLRSLGLKVSYAYGVLDDTCADFAFGLLIAAARRLPECMQLAQGHTGEVQGFTDRKLNASAGVRVSGATLGIVGMGSIGLEVARRAALGFKMRVLYHNRRRRSEEVEREVRATYYQSLDEMVLEVDFLVITASLNSDSKHLIGKKQFDLMKPSAIVVNVSRGQLIEQDALVGALQQGAIRGAALDVTDPEPLPKDHPLLHMPNVIVTAHLSSCAAETMNNMMQNCVDNLLAGIAGRPLLTEAPFE